MNKEELIRYKKMSVEDIDREIVPKIEDMKNKESIDPISIYFMNVGNVLVKCTYAENGKNIEDCFLSYLKKKSLLLD